MNRIKGFTLVELMIVVAIVAILTMVALPSYQAYVLKSHRTAAINAILDLASREARYYTTNNAYTSSLTVLGYSADPMPITMGTGGTTYYNLSVQSITAAAAAAPAGFTLNAAPVGNQLNDTCGIYIYDNLGNKGISSGTLADCWKQ